MKIFNYLILILVLVVMIACDDAKPIDDTVYCEKEAKIYQKEDIALNLIQQKWYLKKNTIKGIDIGVQIKGSIQGDSATLRSYGDGFIKEIKILLNAKKEFKGSFPTFFTGGSIPDRKEFIAGTVITVFKNQQTFEVELRSCPLKNPYLLEKGK